MQFCLLHMNGSGSEVYSIFFDIQKAFDSIPHCKTEPVEYQWFFTKWIIDYLTNRSQCVGVEGATSSPLPILTGVPQGSVLDQLLFIIYTYGLTDVLSNCSMRLYADDLLLYWPIQSPTDYQALQADIDALSDWVSAHKLQFNCDKCKCMLVSQKRDLTMPITLLVNSQPLERVYY